MEKELTVLQKYHIDVLTLVSLMKATEEMIQWRKLSLNNLEFNMRKAKDKQDNIEIGIIAYMISISKDEIDHLQTLYNGYRDKLGVKSDDGEKVIQKTEL